MNAEVAPLFSGNRNRRKIARTPIRGKAQSVGAQCARRDWKWVEQIEKPFFEVFGDIAGRRWANRGFEHASGQHTRLRVLNLAPSPNSPVPAIEPDEIQAAAAP